jgi:hypothetical protein
VRDDPVRTPDSPGSSLGSSASENLTGTVADMTDNNPVPGHARDGTPTQCTVPECVEAVARGDRWLGGNLSVEADGRAHFHHRDELHARVAAHDAADFAEACAEFDAHPTDFSTAWHYLRRHPIFHRPLANGPGLVDLRELTPGDIAALSGPDRLERNDGVYNMRVWVEPGDDSVLVHLEHGPHLWPVDINPADWPQVLAGGQPVFDPGLDVSAPTYEQAVTALAGKVRARYGDTRDLVNAPIGGFVGLPNVVADLDAARAERGH